MANNRTKLVYKNSIITLAMNLLQVFLSFGVRKIFIVTLGVSYLGYNSVFSNILQMLNLADLGIGVAVTSLLYKPLAEKDYTKVRALMVLYKKLYSIIGVIVFAIGIVISLFLGVLIPDSTTDIWYLRLLFFINLIGTVSTYFLAYKRTLIIADQKSYISNLTDGIVSMLISAMQIVLLLIIPNYIVYLVLNIGKAIIANIILSIKCNQMYGDMTGSADVELVEVYKPQVKQYVKDVFISKIGSVVYYGTDNVIISTLRGSLLTGFLSNYTMITGFITSLVSQVLASLQATFGNYINSDKSISEQKTITDIYLCANFLVGNFCMICFIFLVQPFISLCYGNNLLLPFSTANWLGINLMLTVLIQIPAQVFTIYKLYKYDRPIILFSVSLNIAVSVALVKYIGIDGALIGTFITSLIYLFSRLYIISHTVFKISFVFYIKKVFFYFFVSIVNYGCAYFAVSNKCINNTFVGIIIRSAILLFLTICVPCCLLSNSTELEFLFDKLVPLKIRTVFKPIILIPIIAIILTILYVCGG